MIWIEFINERHLGTFRKRMRKGRLYVRRPLHFSLHCGTSDPKHSLEWEEKGTHVYPFHENFVELTLNYKLKKSHEIQLRAPPELAISGIYINSHGLPVSVAIWDLAITSEGEFTAGTNIILPVSK